MVITMALGFNLSRNEEPLITVEKQAKGVDVAIVRFIPSAIHSMDTFNRWPRTLDIKDAFGQD